jgi:hypothetical protein
VAGAPPNPPPNPPAGAASRNASCRCASARASGAGFASGRRLRGLDQRHLGAHQRAVGREPAEQRRAGVVAAQLEPAVREPPGQVVPAVCEQVHERKGQLGHRVDPAQLGVELDRVERHRHAAEPHPVAQMQVAVAFAHPAGAVPLGHQRAQRGKAARAPVAQPGDLGRPVGCGALRRWLGQLGQRKQVVVGPAPDRVRVAGRRIACRRRRQPGLEVGQRLGELVDQCRVQLAARGQPVQALRGVEAAHLHRPVDRLRRVGRIVGPAEQRRIRRPEHRPQRHIELRRRATVDAQLLGAEVAPRRQRREVQKGQPQRLLELEGVGAGQQHAGDVGLDALDRRVGSLALQLLCQCGGQIGDHQQAPSSQPAGSTTGSVSEEKPQAATSAGHLASSVCRAWSMKSAASSCCQPKLAQSCSRLVRLATALPARVRAIACIPL